MAYSELYNMIENSPTKWVALSGVKAELIEERHVRLVMPLGGDMHTNHVGTAYAGSMFALGELSAAMLSFASYGMEEFVPVVQRIEMDFTKPCTTDMIVDVQLSKEEADALIAPVKEKGRGPLKLTIPILNTDEEEVASLEVGFFMLPAKK